LIVCRQDQAAVHKNTGFRPDVNDLLANYEWVGGEVRSNVVVFDDVISGGNHFAACKRLIHLHHPGCRVMGVFIARRVL
jgi:hypothetical protein